MKATRLMAIVHVTAATLFFLLNGLVVEGQKLSVLPVNILLPPDQKAASLTITNQGSTAAAIQIRPFLWTEKDGDDRLDPSDAVVVSPPMASIAPGATQVVRIILHQSPKGQEATYRLLIDEIPPPAEPGIVHIALRLSIPIFAEPETRALAHVQFHLERKGEQIVLVGVNDGLRHEAIRDISLTTADGKTLKPDHNILPYILSGATRRWIISAQDPLPLTVDTIQLNAHSDAGVIQQRVNVVAAP